MTLEETGFLICDILSFRDNGKNFLTKINNFTETDWNTFLTFSARYKLIPLLYSRLLKYKDELYFPSAVKELLQREYMNSAARYAVLQHEIKSLLKILSDNKIDVILLKGAYIAERFYEKPALRPMCDIDILVRKENIDKIFDILLKKEYTTEIKHDRAFHLPVYTKNNILIEVHWDISPHLYFSWKKSMPMNKLFDNTLKEELFGMEILMFPVEYVIVYLCDKVIRDNFRGMLLLLYDIALIINKSTIDWNNLIAVAIEWSSVKDVFCSLYLTRALYFAKIPENIFNSLKPADFNDNLGKFMYRELFGNFNLHSNAVHFMQMISHKNLSAQFKKIFKPENLEVLSTGKETSGIGKIKFMFNRLKYLIKQYGEILSFKIFLKSKDFFIFYNWLKKD